MSQLDDEDDWRRKLNNKYLQPEYQQILSQQNNQSYYQKNSHADLYSSQFKSSGSSMKRVENDLDHEHYTDLDKYLPEDVIEDYKQKKQLYERYDAIRFPSIPKLPVSPALKRAEYQINQQLQADALKIINSSPELNNLQTSESLAGIDFLENMLFTFVEKLEEIKKLVLEHGTYLYSLDKPPEDEDMEYISTIILQNLKSLKNDLKQLVEDMIITKTERLKEITFNC
jgi:lipoate-protein ligase A